MEQGKDIIALDEDRHPCAFQLKSGDITGNVWRRIKGEVDELVEIPVSYPGIDKSIKHRPVLVTNGKITDKVRRDIDDRNLRWKQLGLPELQIITGFELLRLFIDVHGTVLPTQPSEFKTFLELFLLDGRELLDRESFTDFLESVLFAGKNTKPELRRKIASTVLLTQYVLQPYESKNNHISIIEGWTVFCSYLLNLVAQYKLKEKYWRQSYDIIMEKINSQIELLKREFFSREDFTEGKLDGGLFYRSRMTLILGWLCAFELYRKQTESGYQVDNGVHNFVKRYYSGKIWFWGESATPLFIMMSLLASECNDSFLSNHIIYDLIVNITSENNIRDGTGIPDPYISVNRIISHVYQLADADIDMSSFLGSSYHLETLVDFLVRRNKRALLNELWKYISRIRKRGFRPSPPWALFKWHCDKGEEYGEFYDLKQSWKELRDQATELKGSELPSILQENPDFLYYFLICYPHRLDRYTARLIDRI